MGSERVRDQSVCGIRACAGFRPVRDQSEHGIRASTGSQRARDHSEHGIRASTGSESTGSQGSDTNHVGGGGGREGGTVGQSLTEALFDISHVCYDSRAI